MIKMIKIISDLHNAIQNSRKTMEFLTKNSSLTWVENYPLPHAIKTSYFLCLKKVEDEDNLLACIEFSKFKDSHSTKTIETEIRDIMQSAKEIPSLKTIGFVWIVSLPKSTDIQNILEHYFLDNHLYVEQGRKITYIAWAEQLVDINMRDFANTPK